MDGPVHITPYIYNRNRFYFRDHPDYHPDTSIYLQYWEKHEQRSVEGYWGLDQAGDNTEYDKTKEGGWRYMTGPHYWYTQFCFISHQQEGSTVTGAIPPDLRDIDWYNFYIFTIAEGFSGFMDDTKYTCHRLVKKYNITNSTKDFTPKELIRWKRIHEEVRHEGNLKEYIDPLFYIQSTFNKPLGLPLYSNNMTNIVELSSRGTGKSYGLVGKISQKYNFAGARYYKDFLKTKKGPVICVGSALSSKSGELLEKFKFSQDQLSENFGSYTDEDLKLFIPGFFHQEYMGSLSVGNGKNPYRHRFKIKKGNVWVWKGTRTNIVHQSYEANPEAFVGLRSVFMVEDELGLNDKLLKSSKADETVMIMDDKMGLAWKTGTGGNIEKIQESKEVFYNPEEYGYLGFPDLWENREKPIGMFVPAYYQNSQFRDENGNQDIYAAYEQEMHERKIRSGLDSTSALDGWITARPLKPSEIFLSPELNIFPTSMLREHRADVESRNIIKNVATIGMLSYANPEKTKVKWSNGYDKYNKLITTFSLKKYDGHLGGRIMILEHPVDRIPNPTFKKSLYKVTYDPVKDDGTGPSLGSILVYKGYSSGTWNSGLRNTVVASYHGRLEKVEDLHEIAIMLALYYNAKVLVENDIPDFIRYCKREGRVSLLQITPFEAISKFITSPGRKYEFGVRMGTGSLKKHCEQLARQFLLEEVDKEYLENNKDISTYVEKDNVKKVLNLHYIYELKLLDDLIHYDGKSNADAASAFFLLMLWIYQENIVPIDQTAVQEKAIATVKDYFEKKDKHKVSSLEYLLT